MVPHLQSRTADRADGSATKGACYAVSSIEMDYFGPYSIKIGRSLVKRCVVLNIYLAVRAVHLEVSASLSTESGTLGSQGEFRDSSVGPGISVRIL